MAPANDMTADSYAQKVETVARAIKDARINGQRQRFTDDYADAMARAALAALAIHPDAGAGEEELLTIIARSIGRTTGETNYIQRARDVLRSVRDADMTLPTSSTAPAPAISGEMVSVPREITPEIEQAMDITSATYIAEPAYYWRAVWRSALAAAGQKP